MEAFEIDLSTSPRGLLWGLVSCEKARATGVLLLRSSKSGKAEQRKEIIFYQGQPVAVISNFQQESVERFLLSEAVVSKAAFQKLIEERAKASEKIDPVAFFLQSQEVEAQILPEVLERYFRHRLFAQLTLLRGKLSFKPMDSLPDKVHKLEQVKLQDRQEKFLWDEVKARFDESFCKALFANQQNSSFSIEGDFPLLVGPAELREWNTLKSSSKSPSELDLLKLQFLCVAHQFELVRWKDQGSQKLRKELLALQMKMKKMNPFQVLGVEDGAEVAECKKAYFKLVRKYHPDRLLKTANDELKDLCEDILASINEAYSTLSDPEKREEYEAEQYLAAQGGREAIERRMKAEMEFDRCRLSLRRKAYAEAFEVMQNIQEDMKGDREFDVDFAFCRLMASANENKEDLAKQALQVFDQFLKEREDYAYAFYYKALSYRQMGDDESALKWFDLCLEKFPNFNEAASEARVLRMRQEKSKSKSSWFKR